MAENLKMESKAGIITKRSEIYGFKGAEIRLYAG